MLGKLVGAIDNGDVISVSGWAVDLERPDHPLTVNFTFTDEQGNEYSLSKQADLFRPDLKDLGVGSGHCGFYIQPGGMVPGKYTVSASIQNSNSQLVNSPRQGYVFGKAINMIAADITNNCNLRCPFCLYDYSSVGKTKRMSNGTFAKLLELLPGVYDGGFFISCLHEPTLHPDLMELIEMIPEALRKKAFFTTNLTKKLSVDFIDRLANSNIHHINISMDTLDPKLFPILRVNGKLENFNRNLELIVERFQLNKRAPELRYITMAFKSNFDEIPELAKLAREKFLAKQHDVRYTFNMKHIDVNFKEEHLLDFPQWRILEKNLEGIPGVLVDAQPAEDYYEEKEVVVNFEKMLSPPKYPISLQVEWDGTVKFNNTQRHLADHFKTNLNILRDPLKFFTEL